VITSPALAETLADPPEPLKEATLVPFRKITKLDGGFPLTVVPDIL